MTRLPADEEFEIENMYQQQPKNEIISVWSLTESAGTENDDVEPLVHTKHFYTHNTNHKQ